MVAMSCVAGSASSPYSVPGAKTCCTILIFTALCLPEEWRSMVLAGLLAGQSTSGQFAFSAVCFAESFSPI